MLFAAFYAPHTNLTSSSHTQPVQQYWLDLLSGLAFITTLYAPLHGTLKDIILSLQQSCHRQWVQHIVPWTCNLFDCRQLLPPTSGLVASMSGLANNCSITTLYVLYATTLWKDPHSSYTPTNRTIPIGFMSGLAFISPLCIHALPLYFGGHDYRPHGSLATAATRTSVLLSYTLRPSNRHYFPSKSFSPSSQYITLEKKNLTCGVRGQWTLLWSRCIG